MEHHRWHIRGQVQGVGFRPFVFRLARRHGLVGSVKNNTAGVVIDAWGEAEQVALFEAELLTAFPPLARIEGVRREQVEPPGTAPCDFAIANSEATAAQRGRVTVDCATCGDCVRELFDPHDRRYRHGMINCTNCGPRFSIVQDLPYDRASTTMRGFAMCDACAREYADPGNRRFHAQPVCCHDCGPRVRLLRLDGSEAADDPYREAARLLREGSILAIKGLGGYHLAVDATNATAVEELRRRKRRDHKPLAVMVRDLEHATRLVHLSTSARVELSSPAAPIVLARTRADSGIAPGVAPGSHRLGVMLASNPIQHLLMAEGLPALVMTSANRSDEPLVKDDADVGRRLAGIYDAVLTHDRQIERAVDDSVLIDAACGLLMVRRARGYVPTPLELPVAAPGAGLCVGADLKNAVALVEGKTAVLSQHIGDVSHALAYERLVRTVEDLQRLFDCEPTWVGCDRHPSYLTRRLARRLARERGLRFVEVQHHHAHAASLLVERGLDEPMIALACDGVGYGDDGTAWGGEVLRADLSGFERLARLRPLRLPGGDAAARQTGRCGFAWLWDRYGPRAMEHPLAERVMPDARQRQVIGAMLSRGLQSPPSSGLGRIFDAAASLLGVCDENHYEGMSGQRLESEAAGREGEPWEGSLWRPPSDGSEAPGEIDHRALLDRLIEGIDAGEPIGELAWLFHDALAKALVAAAAWAAERERIGRVGLTGGVFCNELLTLRVVEGLEARGLEPILHARVPPNDAGLALGQAGVCAKLLHEV
ncbi:MAG: carbamoyltransferase HypF [Phycisphaerales bacterium]